MKVEEALKIVKDYNDLRDKIAPLADAIYFLGRKSYRHGGGSFLSFEINEENEIVACLDTSCCGSWDQDYITFPFDYLEEPFYSNKLKEKDDKWNQIVKARDEEKQRQEQERELKELDKLKKKYEGKEA